MRFIAANFAVPHSERKRREFLAPPRPLLNFWFGSQNLPKANLRGGAHGPNKSSTFVESLINPVFTVATATQAEYYRVKKVAGDGRCLFRALAQGVSRYKEIHLSPQKEEDEAVLPDNLRMAVQEALCTTKNKQHEFRDVIQMLEAPLPKYCRQLRQPNFWGGEPELIVLSKLLKAAIHVYKKETEFGRAGAGFIKIVEYGRDAKKQRYPPVKLLYSGSNHYDLLLV